MNQQDQPAFDSVERALVFAFNATEVVHVASPLMNTAMAEVPVKKKRAKKGAEQPPDEETRARPASPISQPGERLKGLNAAHQAGVILAVVRRLDPHHGRILAARYTHPTFPCQCQSPCCQGYRPTLRWVGAVSYLCEFLMVQASVVDGKEGLSTDPNLRRLIVERHFLRSETSNAQLARKAKMSAITVAKHAEWITTYLEREEDEANKQIALLLDQEGITGFLG